MHGTRTSFDPTTFAVDVQIPYVSVVSWNVVSSTSAEVVLDVGLAAPVGNYADAFRVYTDHQWVAAKIGIRPATGRAIALYPNSGEQGQTVTVQVIGAKTDFLNAADLRIEPPDDVDIVSLTVVSKTELSLVLGIHGDAAAGLRQVYVDDGRGELSAGFTILEYTAPPTFVCSPSYGLPGNSIVVQVTGTNTHFSPSTRAEIDPPAAGVTVFMLDVVSPTSAILRIDLDPLAPPQSVGLLLTTGLEYARGSFEVLPMPEVTLDPAAWFQREAVTVSVTGSHTHFLEGQTQVSVPPASGLTIMDFQVTGPESITLSLYVAVDATGIVPISFVDSWGLPAQADFTVLPGRPAVELSPSGLPQGSDDAAVTATGYFLNWEGNLTITVEPDCEPFLQVVDAQPLHPSSSSVVFHADVSLLAPLRSCLLTFTYGTSPKHASAYLQILPGYTLAAVPSEVTWHLTEPHLFAVELAAGEALRARVTRDPFTFVDPVLELYSGDGTQLEAPLAVNDDESQATVNARIVYRAQTLGRYYLLVKDRLGLNTGDITLSLDWYSPEIEDEVDAGGDLQSAELLDVRLVRGMFHAGGTDTADFYQVDWPALSLPPAPWNRVLVQVIAQDVSPFETSGANVAMQLYDPLGALGPASSEAAFSPDPALFVDQGSLGFIALANEGLENTAYWLNLRPAVVINEVFHDEERAWEASFVELHGEPGFDLSTCELRALAANSQGPLPEPIFAISLSERSIGPAGYHVVGHDELVPGVTADEAVSGLSINDPAGDYTDIAVVLYCGGVALDAVCYRGGSLPVCEGSPAAGHWPKRPHPGPVHRPGLPRGH